MGRSWAGRLRLGGAIGAGGMTGLVALLLVGAPMAGATSSINFVTPFHNLAKVFTDDVSSTGCHAYANDTQGPSVDLTTGQVAGWVRAVAGNCGLGATWGETMQELGFNGFKFSGPTSGWITATASWPINWTARSTVSGGTGSTSAAYAENYMGLSIWLYDVTTNSFVYNATAGSVQIWASTTTTGTTFQHSHGATFTITAGFAVTSGDTYTVSTVVVADAYDYCNLSGAIAWSEVDFGNPYAPLGGGLASVDLS